jgi:hypothetical protein
MEEQKTVTNASVTGRGGTVLASEILVLAVAMTAVADLLKAVIGPVGAAVAGCAGGVALGVILLHRAPSPSRTRGTIATVGCALFCGATVYAFAIGRWQVALGIVAGGLVVGWSRRRLARLRPDDR